MINFQSAPTHPSSFGSLHPATTKKPYVDNIATTTKAPLTTWATKPPSHFQITTSKRPSFTITTPTPEENEIYNEPAASGCGAKNGSPV